MSGLLCKYSRSEQEGNSRVYPKSATGRLDRRPNEYKGVCRPVYGSANNRGQINKSPFRGSPWKLRGWQTFRWAYRLGHGHAPRGLVHTTGTAGGYDSPSQRSCNDEIFKVSLLIRQNLLESAKRLWLTLHIEHRYHLIHQRAIRISKQNTKVQTAKTDCAIAWSKVCLRNLTPRKFYLKTGTEKVF